MSEIQKSRWSTTPLLDALKSPEPGKVITILDYPALSNYQDFKDSFGTRFRNSTK